MPYFASHMVLVWSDGPKPKISVNPASRFNNENDWNPVFFLFATMCACQIVQAYLWFLHARDWCTRNYVTFFVFAIFNIWCLLRHHTETIIPLSIHENVISLSLTHRIIIPAICKNFSAVDPIVLIWIFVFFFMQKYGYILLFYVWDLILLLLGCILSWS